MNGYLNPIGKYLAGRDIIKLIEGLYKAKEYGL
jgi:hypothetical protein